MSINAERHHWINTIVGILDTAFHLSDEEQYFTVEILRRMLGALEIPGRSQPNRLPAAVALEVTSDFYNRQLHGTRRAGVRHPVRAATGNDLVASVESWRQALMNLLISAYPDLDPVERMLIAKVFNDLLVALGLPDRAASFFPEDVVRAYQEYR